MQFGTNEVVWNELLLKSDEELMEKLLDVINSFTLPIEALSLKYDYLKVLNQIKADEDIIINLIKKDF